MHNYVFIEFNSQIQIYGFCLQDVPQFHTIYSKIFDRIWSTLPTLFIKVVHLFIFSFMDVLLPSMYMTNSKKLLVSRQQNLVSVDPWID